VPGALLISLDRKRHILDMRLDQEYLRSNGQFRRGCSRGIGIWYEMYYCDPVGASLFKNTDPRGSLAGLCQ
jgi:hypothetical protein